MKKYTIVIIALLYTVVCVNMLFAAADTWTQKAYFGGIGRGNAVGFSIGGKGYIGMGTTGTTGSSANFMKDFWEYDPATDTWTQKADFGGNTGRYNAVGFSIGNKGYVGLGYYNDGTVTPRYYKDFWEYDPVTNAWTQKAAFGGTARVGAVGFAIRNKGYVGTGSDGSSRTNDFWEYNPATDTWTRKADFGGAARSSAVGFSIGSNGYIGTGACWGGAEVCLGVYAKDFWEFNPVTNTWTQKADFGGSDRYSAVGFPIGNKGYIGTGVHNIGLKDFWEYDPFTNTWTRKADFGGAARAYAVGFSIGNKGYIGTAPYVKDFWEYEPLSGQMALYFPHIDTSPPWQTEIAIINTGDQGVTGTLIGIGDNGQQIETKAITLAAYGRRQITVANEFTNHTNIRYIIFNTTSDSVQGYTKFYQAGIYRAAIPAVKEVNTSDIYISHIDQSSLWWTGVSLLNTTSSRKDLTMTFNTGQRVPITLNANEHRAFTIGTLLNQQVLPNIRSAVITNAGGIIGLELFGSNGGGNQLDGLFLTDKTDSTFYYPHVASDAAWWTGIVAYNPLDSPCMIAITPYSAQGAPLSPIARFIAGKDKYIGLASDLGLPAQAAWFKIDSTGPIVGFELFGTWDGNQLAAYAVGGTGAKVGIFPKIEKNGWTGIVLVNTENTAAVVTLTAYNDIGAVVATQQLLVWGHAKVTNYAEAIFTQSISGATYIAYSSDKNVVGFQLNGSADSTMLDGLPGL